MKVLKKIGASLVIFILLFGICNVTPIKAAEVGNNRAVTEAIGKFKNKSAYYRDCIIDEAYCTHLETISKVPEIRTSDWTTYKCTYGYVVTIKFHYPGASVGIGNMEMTGTFSTLVTEYEKNPEIKDSYRIKEKENSSNQNNPYKDTSTDYEESGTNPSLGTPPLPEQKPQEPEKVTVSATKIESKMQKGGNLYVNITFSEPIKVTKAPILKVKIGDQTRNFAYNSQTNKSLTYKTTIDNVKDCGKSIVLESLKGGQVECKRANTITTMDYESKLTNKNLGKVGNFIFVEKGSLGDVNKDSRIDDLDVEAVTKSTDKKIADVNGDGKIDELDKTDLKKAVENRNLKYTRFIKTSEFKDSNNNVYIHGDITDSTGSGNPDGVINYHDAEYLRNNLSKISTDKGDVNGDGKVDGEDVIFINTAISNQNPIYLLYVKVDKNNYADIYPNQGDGVINAKDIFAIKDLYNENANANDRGDINKDGRIDLYDQIAISQMLYNNDVTKAKFFKVFVGAKGDINKNGLIDYYDAQKIASYLLSNADTDFDINIADVNGNGKVDLNDSIMIMAALEEDDSSMDKKAALLSNSYFIVPGEDSLGDANEDGVIDYYDAKAIAEYILNKDTSKLNISKADVNKDGQVNINDAINISKQLQGLYDKSTGLKEMEDESGESPDFEYLPGDVNQDGTVNVADLVALNRYLLNSEAYPLTEEQLKAADVADNGDGKVDMTDSSVLINYIAEIIPSIPV